MTTTATGPIPITTKEQRMTLVQTATIAAALGSGVVGGVFFAFSGFVMPALRTVPAATGIRSMQSINRSATTPPLMLALFGTATVCVALAVWAVRSWGRRGAAVTLAAAAVYVVTNVFVTIGANVPRNDSLAKLDPDAAGSAAAWTSYLDSWTAWNHVRAIGGVVAAVLFVVALLQARED